jgi:hypothetical protein
MLAYSHLGVLKVTITSLSPKLSERRIADAATALARACVVPS